MAQAHDVTVETFSTQSQSQSESQSQEIANTTTSSETSAVVALGSQPNTSSESEATSSPQPSNSKKRNRKPKTAQLLATPSPTPSAEMTSLPLLICSIGNPGAAYANTLHSAGHTILQAMAVLLQTSVFSKDRNMGNGMVTRSYDPELPWTLWQSTSYMNESGKGVNAAYRTWQRGNGNVGRVVILHDEMEKPLGSVSVRDAQGLSAKGHNGIKSCMATLGGNVKFVRVGVGIGRPVSRSSEDVSRFVLRKMTAIEKGRIEEAAGEVITKLLALKG